MAAKKKGTKLGGKKLNTTKTLIGRRLMLRGSKA